MSLMLYIILYWIGFPTPPLVLRRESRPRVSPHLVSYSEAVHTFLGTLSLEDSKSL